MNPMRSGRMLKPLLATAMAMMAVAVAVVAYADLTPWKDYQVSDAVWVVTTVKVDPNMDDEYLEGLGRTWIAANEVEKTLGYIEDYKIYRSDLPLGGDFNILLVVKLKSTADLAPSKARYEAFMKEWGAAREKETKEIGQKTYPTMRKITGEYHFREITMKH